MAKFSMTLLLSALFFLLPAVLALPFGIGDVSFAVPKHQHHAKHFALSPSGVAQASGTGNLRRAYATGTGTAVSAFPAPTGGFFPLERRDSAPAARRFEGPRHDLGSNGIHYVGFEKRQEGPTPTAPFFAPTGTGFAAPTGTGF